MNPKIWLSLFAIAVGWTDALQAADAPSPRINVEYSIAGPVTRVPMPSLPLNARQGTVYVGPANNGLHDILCSTHYYGQPAVNVSQQLDLAPGALKEQLVMRIGEWLGNGGVERLAVQIRQIESSTNTRDRIMLAFHGSIFTLQPRYDLGEAAGQLTAHQVAQLQMGQEVTLTSPKVCRTPEQMDAIAVEALRVLRAVHAQLVGALSGPANSGQRAISQSPQSPQAQPGAQRQTR